MNAYKTKFSLILIMTIVISLVKLAITENDNLNNTLADNESTSDLQKIFQSIIDFSNEENTPKQIVSIILTDIGQRFDQIIPTLKDSTNIQSTEKLEKFKNDLNELKQNFTLERISNLKETLDDFITDNKQFINENESSEKAIIDNFTNFKDSLNLILTDLKKLNLKNLDGVNYKDLIDKKSNITNSNLPKECTPECKCCRDNLCVAEEICLNSQKDESNGNDEEDYSAILLSTPFIAFIAFVLLIFAVYVFRKQIFRIQSNNPSTEGYNRQNNVLDVSNANIEMS